MSQWEISASWMGATCQRLPWAGRILQAGEGDIQTQKGSSTVGRSWESAGDWGEAHPRFLECPRLSGSRLAQRVEINKPRSQNSCTPNVYCSTIYNSQDSNLNAHQQMNG